MANITIVATGGTRAPTQLELAERFLEDGHRVRCIATRNALRFLTSHLARSPRRIPFYARLFRPELLEIFAYYKEKPKSVPHVSEGKWADVFVMCPASCNSVGKLASGIGDNYALLVLRASPRNKRVIVVPSMNPEMWFDPQFQRNVDLLNATEKYRVVCPSRGLMVSGDWGFGAQAPLEDIVTETYRALGLLDEGVVAVLAGRTTVPWEEERSEDGEVERVDVLLVDEDVELRENLTHGLAREYPDLRVHQFSQPGQALAFVAQQEPALVFTELSFSGGASARDLIERFRRPGGPRDVQIIASSARERREAGAEALARKDVMYLPKPLNVPFAVGMIGGALRGARHSTPMKRRRLGAGEVLFHEGEEGTELYVVESGRLRLVKREGDQEVEVATVGEKALVGEMAFLGDARRSVTVEAAIDTVLVEVDIDHARQYLERQPEWLRAMIESLIAKLREMNEALAGAPPGA